MQAFAGARSRAHGAEFHRRLNFFPQTADSYIEEVCPGTNSASPPL